MAVDRGYGSGYRNTGMAKPASPKAASAKLRKKGVKAAARKYTRVTTSKAKSVAGSSEYVQRENAARTQLGTAGVAARARQLPTAARAFTREMTGIDVSRKGVSVDPLGVAMAFPVFKAGKAAAALKGALGAIPSAKKAATMAKIAYNEGRVLARIAGREATSGGGSLINDVAMKNMARQGLRDFENIARPITERLPYALKKANRAGSRRGGR